MKHLVALFLSAGLAAFVAAQPSALQITIPDPKTPPAPTTPPKAAPATKAAPGVKTATPGKTAPGTTAAKAAPTTKGATDKAAKKDEPPPKIEGMEIPRGAKGFLGLQVVEGNFKLSFYDAKKKPVAADVVRAVLRWPTNYKPGAEMYVLGPGGDGKSLTAARTVRPPYNFKLRILLFIDGVEEPSETYALDFVQ